MQISSCDFPPNCSRHANLVYSFQLDQNEQRFRFLMAVGNYAVITGAWDLPHDIEDGDGVETSGANAIVCSFVWWVFEYKPTPAPTHFVTLPRG